MQSGAILDSQISASTAYSSDHAPRRARLHGTTGGSWLAKDNNIHQWLQVDLLQATKVIGIATQGRNNYVQWVKEYKLQYGEDGVTFQFYRRDGDNSDTVCINCLGKTVTPVCMISKSSNASSV